MLSRSILFSWSSQKKKPARVFVSTIDRHSFELSSHKEEKSHSKTALEPVPILSMYFLFLLD